MTGKVNEKVGFRSDQIQKEVKKETQDKLLRKDEEKDIFMELI